MPKEIPKEIPTEEDAPFNGISLNEVKLSPKQQKELQEQEMANKQEDKHNGLAFRILVIIMGAFVSMIICSVILHVLSFPELRALESGIVFSQGIITTIIGYLFGVKMSKK